MAEHLTYTPKEVLDLSPDALVYINGSEKVTTCVRCSKDVMLVEDIAAISLSISLEGENQASFEVIAPDYDENRWVVDGVPKILPMHEVEIFMRGRFLVNGEPKYYPVFWGMVQSVSDKYTDGRSSLAVSCTGILRWWEITRVNIQPSLIASQILGAKVKPSPWINVYGNTPPYDIIWHLAMTATGGLSAPEGLDGRFTNQSAIDSKFLRSLDQRIVDYWNVRFRQVGRSLRMFGFLGEKIFPKLVKEAGSSDPKLSIVTEPAINRNVNVSETHPDQGHSISNFKTFGQLNTGFKTFSSEMTSKRELAVQVANAIGYEFYQDTTGEIMFKPPFYNLDVSNFVPFVIEDIDLISSDITEGEREVITRVDVRGTLDEVLAQGNPDLQPYGFYIDPKLAVKFGIRAVPLNMNCLHSWHECFLYAVSETDRLNKRRFMGSATIMGRPEIRVGWPVYFKSKDLYAYVTNVTHSFTFGGSFQTTLGLEAVRRKARDPQDPTRILDNYIHIATLAKSTAATTEQAIAKARADKKVIDDAQEKANTSAGPVSEDNAGAKPKADELTKLFDKDFGVQSGGVPPSDFDFVRDPSIISVQADKSKAKVPATDAKGYDVIGGFPYGRNIEMTARGELKVKLSVGKKDKNTATTGRLLNFSEEGPDLEFESRRMADQALYMTPSEIDETARQIAELDPSMDSSLAANRSAVAKGSGGSVLDLEPARNPLTNCECSRGNEVKDRAFEKSGSLVRPNPKPTTQPTPSAEPTEFSAAALDESDFEGFEP